MGEKWERHNAENGEHIWSGKKHIADIVTDTDNPGCDANVTEIAKSAVRVHNEKIDIFKALDMVGIHIEYDEYEHRGIHVKGHALLLPDREIEVEFWSLLGF